MSTNVIDQSPDMAMQKITMQPKYLWLFMMAYTMAILAANWFDPRHIKILGLNTGAGSIAFPFTYLLADNITEVYGYKNTRITIWAGLLFYAIFLFYGQFVVHHMDAASLNKKALSLFLHVNNHIILAMMANYLITESINAYLVAKLKIAFQGKFMGIRFLISTLIAYFFDELIYAPIAFYGLMDIHSFIRHMVDSWIFMVSIALLLLPFSIRLAKRLKGIEKSDVYDVHTNFNPLSLNTDYNNSDNKFSDKAN